MLKVLTQGPGIEKFVLSSFTHSLKLHERIPIPFSQICVLRSWNLNQKYKISTRNLQAAGGSCSLELHPTTISKSESFQSPQEELVGKIT